ncbi:single-stranded DNA-binding protein [Iningainema tapete]|uniref:Single-stranded DNA-binding protein n=1 Tax=Iningainema tapete BLCC-T55 TaxID=2748662 RepID=A0A8J6XRP9_9CYAN|nr:single-stranded DNA-binding protein [Iningainema tapete]MBD2776256.1 single-stranded DNA-binding protein [Iningainema tapete BLCC-T55]
MNSCILMAEIIQDPQLRYTADNLEVAEMLVQFSALRENEPPATLKVVGWGNMAKEIQQNYHQGDRVLLEGRLGMNTIDRPEGFKEKRAELTVQRIHSLGTDVNINSSSMTTTPSVTAARGQKANSTYESPQPIPTPAPSSVATQDDQEEPIPQKNYKPSYPAPTPEPDVDDIPF